MVNISPAAQRYLGYAYYGPFPTRGAAQAWVNTYCPNIYGVSISGSDDRSAESSQSDIDHAKDQTIHEENETKQRKALEEERHRANARAAAERAQQAAEAEQLFRKAQDQAVNQMKEPSTISSSNGGLKDDANPSLHLKELAGSDDKLALKTLSDPPPKSSLKNLYGIFSSEPSPKYLLSLQSSIDQIRVPPPILEDQAVIGFRKLEEDPQSDAIFLAADAGVTVVDVVGKVGGKEFPPFGLLVITGKAFIAAENAADVYLVQKNEVYDQALAYLKDQSTRNAFGKLVTAVRKHEPISENVSIKMLAAAQAIADPTLNDKYHNWTDALWALQSPAARQAALTRLMIEGGSVVIGEALLKPVLVDGIHGAQAPAYEEANAILEKAHKALSKTTSADGRAFLHGLIDRSNAIIGTAYRTEIPRALLNDAYTNIFTDWAGSHLPE
jgi:hypothetical protein